MVGSSNAVQFFHNVRVACQKEAPDFHDFFDYSLKNGNQGLVNVICSMPDACFNSPEECVNYLNNEFFAKSKSSNKWTDLVESRRGKRGPIAKRTPSKQQKVKARNNQTAPQL